MKKRYIVLAGIIAMIAMNLSGKTWALTKFDPEAPQIFIKAVNPGYTVDGTQNTGEIIELHSDFWKNGGNKGDSILLTGLSIRYANSSGAVKTVYDFPDEAEMTGESLLFRLASTSKGDDADATYTSPNLAQTAGKVEIYFEEKVIDSVCWGKMENEECYAKFDSKKPTTLVREGGVESDFVHSSDYEPEFVPGRKNLKLPEGKGGEDMVPVCKGLLINEILTYYENSQDEQFIELYNSNSTAINMTGCVIRYKNKTYPLNGMINSDGYFARYITDFTLTKNPTSENLIEIIDIDGSIVDSLKYYNGQKKAVAYAQFGYNADGSENWLQTYAPTPGEENNLQKYKTCADGKVLNEETGNCVKASTASSELAPCPEGQYRNPLTNRCKKYESEAAATLKPCAEGYERNPATNRCRKIVSNDGSDYSLSTETFTEKSSFVAVWAIVGVGVLGVLYVIFEYRDEIFKRRD